MNLNGKWIEVFRAGNYGDKGNYTEADLDRMIRNFSPAQHEPPVVIGHPEDNAPAYGWVSALKRVGSTLMAMFKDVPDAFAQLVQEGRFKKRSVSFYTTADGPVLRHVGFLGAAPPEVKGLADVKFRDGQFRAFEFNEEDAMDAEQMKKSIKKAVRDFMERHFSAGVSSIEPVNFSAQITEALKPFETRISELQTQLAAEKTAREAAQAAAAAATATQGHAAFAETQIKRVKDAGKWIPAFDRMGLTQIFTELAKAPAKVSFGEGDKKTEKPVAEVFADFMLALPKIVPMGEVRNAVGDQRRGVVVQFNEPSTPHTSVDQTSIVMADAAKAMSIEKKISYGEALSIVRRSGEYAPNGGSAVGAV